MIAKVEVIDGAGEGAGQDSGNGSEVFGARNRAGRRTHLLIVRLILLEPNRP